MKNDELVFDQTTLLILRRNNLPTSLRYKTKRTCNVPNTLHIQRPAKHSENPISSDLQKEFIFIQTSNV